MHLQEHVSEYGVHWNFFFTLACLPLLSMAAQAVVPSLAWFSWVGGAVAVGPWFKPPTCVSVRRSHSYTHARTRTYAHMHARVHTHTRIRMRTHACACAHVHTHAHTLSFSLSHAGYQLALSWTPLEVYLLDGVRDNLISANKEGLFSVLGTPAPPTAPRVSSLSLSLCIHVCAQRW
jgi:hypothetical protein